MHLTPWHVVGLLATIALIIGVGIYSGRKVRSAADFASGGGKAGAWIVCGAIMGTLVSGQATIGTAQLAFNYGMSAWWFTLGSGIGCLILALGYAAPLRHSGCSTLLQIVSREYGPRAETWGSVLSSIGIFISVVAQILSALEGVDASEIRIPLGSLVDSELVWARGPELRVRALRVGTVSAEFRSDFSQAGVNQTLHKIDLELAVPLTLMLPGGAVETVCETQIPIAETVIVGQVPQIFLQNGEF